MQRLLQQREAECSQVAAQNISLQMTNNKLHGEQGILCLPAPFQLYWLLISWLSSKLDIALLSYHTYVSMPGTRIIEVLEQMMEVYYIAEALAAVRQRAEEDRQLLSYMESSIGILHARLDSRNRAIH